MADAIELTQGHVPWEPSHDAAMVAEYHRYDVPLIGVVRQAGVDFLFRCLVGQTETLSVWCYTLLQPWERARLDATSYDRLEDVLAEVQAERPGTLALALEPYGIVMWEPFADLGRTAEVRSIAAHLFDRFTEWVDALRKDAGEQRVAFA